MGILRVAKRPSCHLATAGIQEIHPAHLSPSTDCRIMNLSESHPQNHFPEMGSGWRSLWGRVQRGWGQAGLHFPSDHVRLVSHPNWGPHWGRTASWRRKLQGSPGSEKQSSSPIPSEGQGQISLLHGVLGNSVWVGTGGSHSASRGLCRQQVLLSASPPTSVQSPGHL